MDEDSVYNMEGLVNDFKKYQIALQAMENLMEVAVHQFQLNYRLEPKKVVMCKIINYMVCL